MHCGIPCYDRFIQNTRLIKLSLSLFLIFPDSMPKMMMTPAGKKEEENLLEELPS